MQFAKPAISDVSDFRFPFSLLFSPPLLAAAAAAAAMVAFPISVTRSACLLISAVMMNGANSSSLKETALYQNGTNDPGVDCRSTTHVDNRTIQAYIHVAAILSPIQLGLLT